MVSLDLYVNETNKHADYVLPTTTWLEREDVPGGVPAASSPSRSCSTPRRSSPPYGEARQEWQIIEELSARVGVAPFVPTRLLSPGPVPDVIGRGCRPASSLQGAADCRLDARRCGRPRAADRQPRAGQPGASCAANPHGIVLADEHARPAYCATWCGTAAGKVRLDPPQILAELAGSAGRGAGPRATRCG